MVTKPNTHDNKSQLNPINDSHTSPMQTELTCYYERMLSATI